VTGSNQPVPLTALALPLDRDGDAALHDQIYAGMRGAIERHELEPGAFLPPENRLAEYWSVARGTVRRAIGRLANEGLLERLPGRGTWVSSFKIRHLLGRLTSFTEDMRSRGVEPGSELLSIDSVAPGLGMLQLFGGDEQLLWKLMRRRFANGLPVAVETCYIRSTVINRQALEAGGHSSLYDAYRMAGVRLHRAIQLVEAVNLGPELAAHLEVKPNVAAFKQERITYGSDDRIVEVVESYYRGDLYKLQVELRGLGE
jgi:GntR family transcriptional regulator